MSRGEPLRLRNWHLCFLYAVLALGSVASAEQRSDGVAHVDAEGTVHLPPLDVPASRFMSAESRAKFISLFSRAPAPTKLAVAAKAPDPRQMRADDEQKNAPLVAHAKVLWPVTIESRTLGGVRIRVITPKAGVAAVNRDRVLINLHGGGFIWGEGNGALTESIPIAGVGRITVITVAYRMAPESAFPAASQDVTAVYRELLKTHRASDIGIYGCSAGGMLTAESVAWFIKEGLPAPGAIGTFCGSLAFPGGDSSHLASPLVGEKAWPGADTGTVSGNKYLESGSSSDPLVMPVNSPELLKKFPPTLLIAGSRDPMVSSLFKSQAALAEAGVDAELHVWDGMWHAFFMDPDLPESQQVFRVVVRFFEHHLGTHP